VIPDVDAAVGASVRGQYAAGTIDGRPVPAYRDEEGVDPKSRTETFVALRLEVDNWRWAGVPLYIRTGKRLPKRATEVVMQFQRVPHLAFGSKLTRDLRPNSLQLRIQPEEGVCLSVGAKVPGEAFRVRSVDMEFSYADVFPGTTAGGYERLLHDVMIGDATLFIRTDEVERSWRIVDPFLQAWADDGVPLAQYRAGTWGPRDADLLLARDLRQWHEP
jgi:glucose-6-phosphate 1-dehydrogenase